MTKSHARRRPSSCSADLLLVLAAAFVLARAPVRAAQPPDHTGASGFTVPSAPQPLRTGDPTLNPQSANMQDFVKITTLKAKAKLSGKGLAVAVIDSGVNPRHISFDGQLLPGRNFTGQGPADDTADTYGHGSHVAGIIAARKIPGPEQPADGPILPGIAHETRIIPLKVYTRSGDRPTLARINEALKWVLDSSTAAGSSDIRIGAVAIALGSYNFKQPDDAQRLSTFAQLRSDLETYNGLIKKLYDQHIAVVTPAGNEYVASGCEQGMGMQAICKETISVGAIYDYDYSYDPPKVYEGDASASEAVQGRCTPFTQRLGELAGKEYRTDIFAPGSEIDSMGAFDSQNPTYSRFGRATHDGTSYACPVVAGVVLLLQEQYMQLTAQLHPANPLPSVDLIVDCLRDGGWEFKDVKNASQDSFDNAKSCGESFVRIDAYNAYRTLAAKFSADLARIQAAVSTGQNNPFSILGIPVAVQNR
jgi:subtilisin family serine protease